MNVNNFEAVTVRKNRFISLMRRLARPILFKYYSKEFNNIVLKNVMGKHFVVLPKVFHPGLFFTSKFFVSCLNKETVKETNLVLDMGTGSGIAAIFAADYCKRVIATDINPYVVRCAKINVMLNNLEDKIEVRGGDLFEPVEGEKFDVILHNPPFYPGNPKDWLEYALKTGDNNEVVFRFIRDAGKHLNPGGRILVILSTDAAINAILNEFKNNGYTITLIASKRNIG
ncbi:MAG TPA: HemK2/MTQ2 family protein methyltransferase, partial [Candidatus Brocadiales bacterium]|nr:HemK2/MTQ2 family protein methyltransferase [Candidatus Brocadiales bacterium]